MDQAIATAFETDLGAYKKIDDSAQYAVEKNSDMQLFDIRKQIPLQYGDSVPSFYLNDNNTQGIALKQDSNGTYYLYNFQVNTDKDSDFAWMITDTKTVQGEYKAINPTVGEYFVMHPNPPTCTYVVEGESVTMVIEDNNK